MIKSKSVFSILFFLFISLVACIGHADPYIPSADHHVDIAKPLKKYLNFKDYIIGVTEIDDENIRKKFKCEFNICTPSASNKETISWKNINKLELVFSNNKLSAITIIIEQKYFTLVIDSLISKFGEPFKKGVRASSMSAAYHWSYEGNHVVAESKYFGSESIIMFLTDEMLVKTNDISRQGDI